MLESTDTNFFTGYSEYTPSVLVELNGHQRRRVNVAIEFLIYEFWMNTEGQYANKTSSYCNESCILNVDLLQFIFELEVSDERKLLHIEVVLQLQHAILGEMFETDQNCLT
jgi:hypothetical protein